MLGGPRMTEAVSSVLPSSLPIGNPDTVGYRAHSVLPFLIPGGPGTVYAAAAGAVIRALGMEDKYLGDNDRGRPCGHLVRVGTSTGS
jgi:hypothetical protein